MACNKIKLPLHDKTKIYEKLCKNIRNSQSTGTTKLLQEWLHLLIEYSEDGSQHIWRLLYWLGWSKKFAQKIWRVKKPKSVIVVKIRIYATALTTTKNILKFAHYILKTTRAQSHTRKYETIIYMVFLIRHFLLLHCA